MMIVGGVAEESSLDGLVPRPSAAALAMALAVDMI